MIANSFHLHSLLGCALIYAVDNRGVRLFSYYIFVSFASGLPLSLSLVSSNVAGYTKKATVSAMMFIAYCAGNIIGPFLFFSREAPRYQVWLITDFPIDGNPAHRRLGRDH